MSIEQEKKQGWIAVDLDGTLAHYDGWLGEDYIGPPIPEMVERVKEWIAEGREVKIFTARVGTGRGLSPISGMEDTVEFAERQRALIEEWSIQHIGVALPVTAQKDYAMGELWDDRAIQVATNTGRPIVTFWKDLFSYIYGNLGGGLLK